ncbi:MAG TPA: hypothetical protein VN372_03765 [Methanospirillum sp.]|nr:hypothetical protein [Methanospirillum sp.]
MTNLNTFDWITLTAQKATADIAWSYDIKLHGVTGPDMFRKLEYQPDPDFCAMLGDPVESSIDSDYPGKTTSVTAYSYGYYFKNQVSYDLRQTKAGVDIPAYARAGSNYGGEVSRTSPIVSYENPGYYVRRLLFPVDSSGTITKASGYYNLYLGRIELVPNWGLGSSDNTTLTAVLAANATTLYVSNLALFSTGKVMLFTYTDSDSDGVWDDDEDKVTVEVCPYTAKSGSSGAGYLTIVRTSPAKVWNPSSALACSVPDLYDPYHPEIQKKQFAYDGETISGIFDDLNDYCHMISFTKFKKVDGEWREYFYWIPKYRLDEDAGNYLELPTEVTIILPTTQNLIGSPGPGASVALDQSYNTVWVEACRTKDSAWFYAKRETAAVTAGLEVPRVLIFRTKDLLPDPAGITWNEVPTTSTNFGPGGVNYGTPAENAACQALAEAKAEEVLKFANYQVPTFTASFKDTQFEHYQQIQFSGFEGFPSDIMRVMEITYEFNPPDSGGQVTRITCAKKETLKESGKYQSVIDEIRENFERLKESVSNSGETEKQCAVLDTYDSGTMAIVQLRSTGALVKTKSYGLRAAP